MTMQQFFTMFLHPYIEFKGVYYIRQWTVWGEGRRKLFQCTSVLTGFVYISG